MKTIIGYTDSITECDCCGKTQLKGTYCIDLDGTELYYGSVCAFKNHELSIEEQKELKATFVQKQKNDILYNLHILPLKKEMGECLENTFTLKYEDLDDLCKKMYNQIQNEYNRVIILKSKKYKIKI